MSLKPRSRGLVCFAGSMTHTAPHLESRHVLY